MAEQSRAEHLAWCKKRALECLDRGQPKEAFTSMASDLNKHDETRNHAGIDLGLMLLITGSLESDHEMRRFIEGFN